VDRFAYGRRDPQARELKVIARCACGCGEEIVEGYEYIEAYGEWFADTDCFLKYHDAAWRCAGVS
jgi:hypothetical protein